ncbi:hypothetical protein EfmJHP10_12670 [Enterococcus faecium]|nr:hypothetical protein EfmJHP10_12670 [Enterococcus faecium]
MNDSIKKMLRITEKDLMITEVSYETLQKKKTLVVDAVLSPTPRACRSCGSTVVDGNGKAIIVKNGKKETIVRFEQYNHIMNDSIKKMLRITEKDLMITEVSYETLQKKKTLVVDAVLLKLLLY